MADKIDAAMGMAQAETIRLQSQAARERAVAALANIGALAVLALTVLAFIVGLR